MNLLHNYFLQIYVLFLYTYMAKQMNRRKRSVFNETHLQKNCFSKIEELRNYVKKKERTSEQCHEFVKKNKNRL